MKPGNIIEVNGLKKAYKTSKRDPGLINAIKALFKRQYMEKEALKGITFSVKKGEILGLIGPNGAGKSTTIKALSGVLFPTSGTVEVLGYTPWEEREDYVQHIGVVFGQKPQLVWDLPAMDSFEMHKEVYNIPPREYATRLKRMIRLLSLEEVVKKPVRDLSLGERMKCKLVASLLHNPDLVFLDEPSIGLDVIAKNIMRDFIIETNKHNRTTFIITTHDMQEIERLCKRVIIINHGGIVYDGPLHGIKQQFQSFKVVDVKMETERNTFSKKGCTVLEKRPYELRIQIDTKKTTIKEVINLLIKRYDVADINVSDPPIEEIIELVFRQ
ncbi:ATP-binding cassette domain-containing protein [Candidatus Woesearchaeota archaeon]|nr:ATP-binding cassette domain-containing protein [Candidatus Woesearchaeota archaeon]